MEKQNGRIYYHFIILPGLVGRVKYTGQC